MGGFRGHPQNVPTGDWRKPLPDFAVLWRSIRARFPRSLRLPQFYSISVILREHRLSSMIWPRIRQESSRLSGSKRAWRWLPEGGTMRALSSGLCCPNSHSMSCKPLKPICCLDWLLVNSATFPQPSQPRLAGKALQRRYYAGRGWRSRIGVAQAAKTRRDGLTAYQRASNHRSAPKAKLRRHSMSSC